MNIAHFIARRYSKSKKTRNVINLITIISVVGIMISTAALVILLSAFNGIEQMVVKLYSDFDSSLTVRSKHSKTFNQGFIDIEKIQQVNGVENTSRALEEVVILRNEEKWVHAKLIGVDSTFLVMSKITKHLVDGIPVFEMGGMPQAIFGATLLDKLDGYIPTTLGVSQRIIFNVPLREGRLRPGKNPFNVRVISASARINYNREVNAENVLISYDLAQELLDYKEDISALYIDVNEKAKLNQVKKQVQQLVGDDFVVKTNFEKNELIFKTSQSERLIIYFILVFVFILASFNLIASITMLFVEKRDDISTLISLGADKSMVFKIFFFQAAIIVGRGVLIGLILGYGVTFAQIYFDLIAMPSIPGESFPMVATWGDAGMILGSVLFLGFIVSYFPTKYLVGRHPKFRLADS